MLLQMSAMSVGGSELVSSSGQSTVGWTPGVTDWLTHRCRPVGRTGVCHAHSHLQFTPFCAKYMSLSTTDASYQAISYNSILLHSV